MFKIWNILLIAVMLLLINGCGGGSSKSLETNEKKELSFYTWDGISNYKKSLDHLVNYDNVVIYLNPVDNGDGSSDKFISNVETIHNDGNDVWSLMSGDPDSDYIDDQIDTIVNYNNTHTKKIIGMSFDIEPWTEFEDQNSSDNRDDWQDYLDFLTDMANRLHNNGLKISASIPFWLNTVTEAFPNGRNLNYEVVDIVDETIVMDYTIFHDRFYKFAQNTLEYADGKKGKSVKIALEMVDTDEENVSFYNNPDDIKPFLTTDIPNSSFDGYMIHTLDAFSDSNITIVAP